MTITEFRSYAEALGRFASAREKKAPGPKDTASHKHNAYAITWDLGEDGQPLEHRPRMFVCKSCSKTWLARDINRQYDPTDSILIQATNGRLKLVAGTADSTLIVDAGETSATGKALISAKLLLNAAKSLRGKGTVEFEVTPEGATVRVSTGAEMGLPNTEDKMPDWVRVPKQDVAATPFPAGFLAEMAKVFDATTGKYWPYSHVAVSSKGQALRFAGSDRYAVAMVDLEGPEVLGEAYRGSISSVFTGSLRGIDGGGTIRMTDDTLWLVAGPYTAVTRLYEAFSYYFPSILEREPDTTAEIDKKVLIDMVKGVASQDEHNRVALAAREATLTVHPFLDPATSVKAPALVQGEGSVGLSSDILSRCLAAYPGKSVTLGWSPGRAPLRIVDRTWPWTLLIAPVVQ
jgi:hypothetical protein